MAKYVLTNKAVNDLSDIWNYTYETWSENQADKYYELLVSGFKEVAKKPLIGKAYTELSTKIRGFKAGKHIIFYREINVKQVEIVRILHNQMDLKSRMND